MKRIKKAISVFLSAITVFAFCAVGVRVSAADHCAYTPIIHVQGYPGLYATKADGTRYKPIDGDDDSENTVNAVKALIPDLLKAIATNDYDAYCDKAYEEVAKIYAPLAPNLDGTMPEGTGVDFSWSASSIPASHGSGTLYRYVYDTRLSPLDIADDLNAFIETVKAKTGHSQVVLTARCVGTNVALAYLYKYQRPVNYAGIKNAVFVYGGLGGFSHLEHILSGTVKLTDDGVYYFSKNGFSGFHDFEGFGGGELGEFLFQTIDLLRTTGGLNVTCQLVNKIYDKVKDKFIARVLKDYYGVSLTQVSAIVENYEAYKSYVFQEPGDLEKYAYFIGKADEYHNTVMAQRDAMLKELDALGKPVYFIGDYGDQAAPISEEANYAGDSYATLTRQTLGATVSTVSGTLSKSYIAAQKAKGLEKYISPDKQVDASTCLFPDRTFIVKNLHHNVNTPAQYALICRLAYSAEPLTVESMPEYPQFLNCPSDTASVFVPAKAKNENDTDWGSYDREAIEGTVGFLKKMIDWITALLQKLYRIFSGQWMLDLMQKQA